MLHSHSIDFSFGFLKSRSLSLWPMNETPLYCILHACSDNEDTTKLFSSPISRLLSIMQSLANLERKDYNISVRYVTLIKEFQNIQTPT